MRATAAARMKGLAADEVACLVYGHGVEVVHDSHSRQAESGDRAGILLFGNDFDEPYIRLYVSELLR